MRRARSVCASQGLNKEKASTRLVDKAIEHFGGVTVVPPRHEILLFMLRRIKDGESYHPGSYALKKFVEEVEIRLTDNLEDYAYSLEKELWRV